MTCPHERFKCDCGVQRITTVKDGPVTHYSAEISLHCTDCGVKFEFVGLPLGSSPYRPTGSMDGLIAYLPMMPEGQKVPDGLPSLSVKMSENPNG